MSEVLSRFSERVRAPHRPLIAFGGRDESRWRFTQAHDALVGDWGPDCLLLFRSRHGSNLLARTGTWSWRWAWLCSRFPRWRSWICSRFPQARVCSRSWISSGSGLGLGLVGPRLLWLQLLVESASRPLGLPILLTALIGSIPTRPVVCFGPRVDALGVTLPKVRSIKSVLTPPLAPAAPIIHKNLASPRGACFLRSPGLAWGPRILGGGNAALKKSAALGLALPQTNRPIHRTGEHVVASYASRALMLTFADNALLLRWPKMFTFVDILPARLGHVHAGLCASVLPRTQPRALPPTQPRTRAHERKQSAGGARFSPRFPQGYGAVALLSVFSALVGKEGFEPLLSAVLLSVFGMMGGLVWRSFTTTFDESARYITNSIRWRRQEAAFLVCHFLSPVCVSSARCFYFMKLQARPHERP